MPEHARSGGVAGSRAVGGDVDIAGRSQGHTRVLDGRLVVLAEPESGDGASYCANHGDHWGRERTQGHGESDERGQQRPQQRGADGQGAAGVRHATLHQKAVHR